MQKIDVCINVFGKPYQTLVTLKSLLNHSSKWIDKIFFIEEANQPYDYDFNIISNNLNYDGLIRYKPKHWWLSNVPVDMDVLKKDEDYLHSVRYEYGIKTTDKSHILTIHNDLLFTGDVVGFYLNNLDHNYFAVGEVGQCWNCPMNYAKLCNGELLEDNINNEKYSYGDILNIFKNNKPARPQSMILIDKIKPFPLPECRVNEWCALLDVNLYDKNVIPNGNMHPYGGTFYSKGLDTGNVWFREMVNAGYRFKNINPKDVYVHAYFGIQNNAGANGWSALFDKNLYDKLEELAKVYFKNNF